MKPAKTTHSRLPVVLVCVHIAVCLPIVHRMVYGYRIGEVAESHGVVESSLADTALCGIVVVCPATECVHVVFEALVLPLSPDPVDVSVVQEEKRILRTTVGTIIGALGCCE